MVEPAPFADKDIDQSRVSSIKFVEIDDEEEGLISRNHRTVPTKNTKTIFLTIFLLSLIIANLLLFARLKVAESKERVAQFSPPIPDFGTHAEVFTRHELFATPPDEENTKAWNDLIPIGKGFVVINHDESQEELPGMDRTLPQQHAMVSTFHQLHCLYAVREGYYSVRDGDFDRVPSGHLDHCFDFLRQALMCFADTTLEWIPENGIGSTGWGYQHRCGNYEAVKDWAADRLWKNYTGIH